MRSLAIVGVLAACEGAPPPPAPAPPPFVYAPVLTPPRGRVVTSFGRGVAPTSTPPVGITGTPKMPLRLPTVWQVPGKLARALVYGTEGETTAIELIDIDAGRVIWRDAKSCSGPVVGVTETRAVCTDAKGTRAIDLADGSIAWETTETYVAIDEDRVTIAGLGAVSIRNTEAGDELAHVVLPEGVFATSIVAACSGTEVFSTDRDGRLVRIAPAPPTAKVKGMAIAWHATNAPMMKLDACGTPATPILVTQRGARGVELVAVARDTGKTIATLDGVRGWWHAEPDRIVVASETGTTSYARDLSSPAGTPYPVLGASIAAFGDRRLVRVTSLTAALLDRGGVVAYVPFGEMAGALGATALIAGTWQMSNGETLHRRLLPVGAPRPTASPQEMLAAPPVVAAELRDLPALAPVDQSALVVAARPDTAMHAVGAVVLDPDDPSVLYAITLEQQPDERSGAGVARADLAKHVWRWSRADGCGYGKPVAIAVARDLVACGSRTNSPGTGAIRATVRETGVAKWEWRGDNVDAIAAAGDLVLAYDADRASLIDARTGTQLGYIASDDGGVVRATIVARGVETWLATYEHGTITFRLPLAGMLPVVAVAVHGVVRALSTSGDGVLVELEDGDVYRIDLVGPRVVPIPAPGSIVHADRDLVTAESVGGPIYAAPAPTAPRPVGPIRPLPPSPPQITPPAPLSTPLPAPAIIGHAWQYTLFSTDGGVVARNDYALVGPTVPALARVPTAPLAVTYGPGLREVLVLDARTGDPLRRVRLPDDAPLATSFATLVDGKPVVGVVLAAPLRIAPL